MTKTMTQGKEWKHILLFTLPLIAGNLLQQTYNAVDAIIVGNYVNQTALSAVGTCAPLTMLFVALAVGGSNGCAVMCAQYYGAGDRTELRRAVSTSISLFLLLGAVLTVLGQVFARLLLAQVMQVPADVLDGALVYLRIYCLGLLFLFVYNISAALLRALGDSRASLIFLVIAAVVNIGLDLLFVVMFQWGVVGAAIATTISQGASAAAAVIYMVRRYEVLRLPLRELRLYRDKTKTALALGIPAAMQQAVISFGSIAIQRVINWFGEDLMAGITAGNRVYSIMMVFNQSFSLSLSTFVGQNIGAGRLDRVRRGLRHAIVISCSCAVVMGVAVFLLAEPLTGLFGVSDKALAFGAAFVRTGAILVPVAALYQCCSGVLRGAGDMTAAMCITCIALLLRTAATYLTAYLTPMAEAGVWFGLYFDWIPSFVMAYLCYRYRPWRKKAVVVAKADEIVE